jgi:hypothetical protein
MASSQPAGWVRVEGSNVISGVTYVRLGVSLTLALNSQNFETKSQWALGVSDWFLWVGYIGMWVILGLYPIDLRIYQSDCVERESDKVGWNQTWRIAVKAIGVVFRLWCGRSRVIFNSLVCIRSGRLPWLISHTWCNLSGTVSLALIS